MGIDAIHLNGAMTGIQDYNSMRQQEEAKVFLDTCARVLVTFPESNTGSNVRVESNIR